MSYNRVHERNLNALILWIKSLISAIFAPRFTNMCQ